MEKSELSAPQGARPRVTPPSVCLSPGEALSFSVFLSHDLPLPSEQPFLPSPWTWELSISLRGRGFIFSAIEAVVMWLPKDQAVLGM